jgi:Arc/MetJ-type ribon-helix-helix transcriptional regulator
MTDCIATIRLPPSLLSELKKLADEQYFIDESELIRNVLRKNYDRSVNAGQVILSDALIEGLKKRLKEGRR